MKKFKHLGQHERDRIEALLVSGQKQATIAKILGVNKSTISREIRLKRKRSGEYKATRAQQKAYVKRRESKYQGMKVESDCKLKRYVIAGLKAKRSPDEIAGRMKKEKQPFHASKDGIYHWLYSAWGQPYAQYLCTKRYKRKKQRRSTKRVMIPHRIGIEKRPLGATNRTRYGHCEVDTAVAPKRARNTHAIAVGAERKAKLIVATKISSLSSKKMTNAMNRFQKKIRMCSATTDNGIENRDHKNWPVPAFFAAPHSPWQKPLVENSIALLRRWFFKKGTDWSTVSEPQLKKAILTLNNKYRKSLGYASALEVAIAHGIIISDPNSQSCI